METFKESMKQNFPDYAVSDYTNKTTEEILKIRSKLHTLKFPKCVIVLERKNNNQELFDMTDTSELSFMILHNQVFMAFYSFSKIQIHNFLEENNSHRTCCICLNDDISEYIGCPRCDSCVCPVCAQQINICPVCRLKI
jgi:hypothetical protein